MNLPEFSLWIFLSGCIGSLSPEIVRLYKIRNKPKFNWSPFYLIISLLFVLLGGFVAWILPATSLWGAFYAGVSLPVIISSIGKSKKLKEKEILMESEFVSQLRKEREELKKKLESIELKYIRLTKRLGKRETIKKIPKRIIHKVQFFVPTEVAREKFVKQQIDNIRNYLGALF